MNMVFIYGPPATGKLTVATELASLTGYSLFHNHITRDVVGDIYGAKLKENYQLVNDIRNLVFTYCAKNNTDIIFTVVIDGPEDNQIIDSYINSVKQNGGDVLFVELKATDTDIINRIGSDSRKKFNKLTDKVIMQNLLDTVNYPTLPQDNVLKLNTSELSPLESATTIVDHFNLLSL